MKGKMKILDKDGKVLKEDNLKFNEGECIVLTTGADMERVYRRWKAFKAMVEEACTTPLLILEPGDEIKIIRFGEKEEAP